MEIFWKLGYILYEIDKFNEYAGLFVPETDIRREVELAILTSCAVLHVPYKEDDPDFRPPFAVKNNLYCISLVQMATDIVVAARHQKPNSTAEDLLKAFIYYLRNDAYYEFPELTEKLSSISIFDTLDKIILRLNELPFDETAGRGKYVLYKPCSVQTLERSTLCMVLFINEDYGKDYKPLIVEKNNFCEVANIMILAIALERMKKQKSDYTTEEVIRLFNSYLENNTFSRLDT